jgi:CheY-like chemotaxis protein/anti-sigma regulatory factor (Ser/Thr protein kinase)
LDFAKAEAGKLGLLPVPFRAATLLKSVVAMMESLARGKGLDLRLKFMGDLDAVIVADEARLRQVLVNIIGNAVKFTEQGFVEVKASLAHKAEGDGRLTIIVSDTGPGLDRAVADRLFSPYSQANIDISRKFGGTGLGLALCRQLSDLMGGQLSVDSVVNVGTSFTFAFPIAFGSEERLPKEAQESAVESQSRHVLLAEDQFINQRLAIAILERAGHRVTLASSGVEAVLHARATNFDVILMDIQMPEMDGIAASKSIRAMGGHNAAVPIIAVTAQALPDEIEKCLAAGMTEYVAKPIDERQLLVSIQRLTAGAPGAATEGPGEAGGGNAAAQAACPHLNMAVIEQVEVAIGREDAVMLWEKLAALLDELLTEAPAALEADNLAGLASMAHKLVGAAGALGASATSDLCRAIEQDAKAGGSPKLPGLVARLSLVAAESLDAINRRFNAQIKLVASTAKAAVRAAE